MSSQPPSTTASDKTNSPSAALTTSQPRFRLLEIPSQHNRKVGGGCQLRPSLSDLHREQVRDEFGNRLAFMLMKIHPLEADYGMGYTYYYLSRLDPTWKDSPKKRDYVDLFLATTIGYGNMGWLVNDWGSTIFSASR